MENTCPKSRREMGDREERRPFSAEGCSVEKAALVPRVPEQLEDRPDAAAEPVCP